MDPIIAGIMSGIITNCLMGLAKYLGGSKEEISTDKRTELHALVKKATEEVAETIDWKAPPRLEEVCLFLTSPEVESMVRQILSAKMLGNGNRRNVQSIEREFTTSLSLFVSESDTEVEEAATKLFQALLEECENELEDAISRGILSAHEAKSTMRYHIILDEVETIGKNLSFLSSQKSLDVKAVLEFEEKYRQQVSDRHQYVVPPHFDVARKIPIDELYVMPLFIKKPGRERDKEPAQISGEKFIADTYRSIVLGDPGSGKSTFSIKVCHDLSTNKVERCFCGGQLSPILVILRDYSAEKKTYGVSILQHIEGIANSRYQLTPPVGAFEYLILNGRAVVIFDGLDELLDTSYRQEISNDIESFCKLYPSVPVLVTSRSVGYEQAPLDEKRFEVFKIAEFDSNQVDDYVTKWFANEQELTLEQRNQKVKAFLDESSIVPDLRRNPLMLALMCNIYLGENYIPRNRPDVYEKCAMMLFERWDLSRGIRVQLPFEAHIRPAMMYLAHWVYRNDTLQGGATERQLIDEVGKYLLGRRFEDCDEAKAAAREFVEFCRGRAWVFTDTGTTKEGERLYQFTHRTFLEYFTASHLVRTHSTATSLETSLTKRIGKGEWDSVAQLSFQILNKNTEGAGDELLRILVHRAEKQQMGSNLRWTFLNFAARCLEFIVPSPKITRAISSACTRESLNRYADFIRNKKKVGKISQNRDELLESISNVAVENLGIVIDELLTVIVEIAKGRDKTETLAALETGLFLPSYQGSLGRKRMEFTEMVYEACNNIINELRKEVYIIGVSSFLMGDTTMKELIEWYSIERIFTETNFNTSGNKFLIDLASILNGRSVFCQSSGLLRGKYDINKAFEEVGSTLIQTQAPWVEEKNINDRYLRWRSENLNIEEKKGDVEKLEEVTITRDSLFGRLILLGMTLEVHRKTEAEEYVDFLTRFHTGLLCPLKTILRARLGCEEVELLPEAIQACGFVGQEEEMALQWRQGKVDFVKKSKTTKGKRTLRDR